MSATPPLLITLYDDGDDDNHTFVIPPSLPSKPCLYPNWDQLPDSIRQALDPKKACRLSDPAGFLAFRYGGPTHRNQLLLEALKELANKVDSGRDHSVAASHLANYFAQSVSYLLRREGDLNTSDFYVADDRHHIHRLVSTTTAAQTICDAMHGIIETIDSRLLHGNNPSAHRLEIDRLKEEIKTAPAEKKPFLRERIRFANQVLVLRSMFTSNSNKVCIAKEYLNKTVTDCFKRGRYATISQDNNWLPMSNGFDLNLATLETRRRWLDHHIVGLCNAVFNIPREDTDPSKLSDADRRRLFGPIPTLINRLAAENLDRAHAILVSLYLQLLGHNKHKYLIIYQGEGHNGKSLLITLLRETLGELCAPLHKSILFATKETASHSGFQIQLDSIRSGYMDDLGPRDTFNEQAVKMIVSPDVEMVMREAGHTRRGAAKARYRIGCSLILCCNYGSMPKIKMDMAMVNRFRIIPFAATFVNGEPTPEQLASGKVCYRAEPTLLDQLKQPQHLSHFINYVVMAGHYWYQRHIKLHGEPLVNEPQVQEALLRALVSTEGPASSSSLPPSSPAPALPSFEDWWTTHVSYRPGELVPIATLAAAYAASTGTHFHDPSKEFGQLLQTAYPTIVRDKKKQLMSTVGGVRSKRMCLLDYQLSQSIIKAELVAEEEAAEVYSNSEIDY